MGAQVIVDTWTDEPCGCSRSSFGWWIVRTTCEDHAWIAPLAHRDYMLRLRLGTTYGPVQPPGPWRKEP